MIVADSEQARAKFIAGAVCPSCQAMDRIVVTGDADSGERRCVACGYSDSIAPASGGLPGTRFSKAPGAAQNSAAGEQPAPVRIISAAQPTDKRSDN